MIDKKFKIYIAADFRLMENAFVKFPCLWHGLIINPTCRTAPHPFNKNLSSICHETILEKGHSILFGGDTMPLLHWKIIWGYMLPQYLQGSAD